MATLLDQERVGPCSSLLVALLEQRANSSEPAVRLAAQRVLDTCAPWALDFDTPLAKLVEAAGDRRDQQVFVACSLGRSAPRSLGEVGSAVGVSGARVGQLRDRAEQRVRNALDQASDIVRWLPRSLWRRLGQLTSVADADEALADHGVGGSDPAGSLVLWLAGPYRMVPGRPGWLAIDPAGLGAATLAFVADDGGVRSLTDAKSELGQLGVGERHLLAWLRDCGAVVMEGTVVLTAGRLPDAVERILDAHGRAMAPADIAACLGLGGREVAADALGEALRGSRFRHLAPDFVELSDWPRDDAVAPQVRGAVTKGPGPTRLRPAATPARGPAPQSSTKPAAKPARRPAPQPAKPPSKSTPRPVKAAIPSATRRASRPVRTAAKSQERVGIGTPDAEVQRSWLWVRVDKEVLRGGEGAIPPATAELVGLRPQQRRTFSSRFGPVTLIRDDDQTTRGSVRAVALAAGANDGDTLILGLSGDGDVLVEVHRPSQQGQQGQQGQATQQGAP